MDQAEQLRNIVKQQNKKQRSARVITVTSGKGGVGKSNVSVNLAIQMSRLGKRAVILDADFGLANIEVMLGMRPQYNLADMTFRGKDVKDIICTGLADSTKRVLQNCSVKRKVQLCYLSKNFLISNSKNSTFTLNH